MTILTAQQVAAAWIGAGGPRNRAVEFTAISYAEASWDTVAVSVTDARGLWQVEPANFTDLGLPLDQWADPHVNARAAVLLSSGGQNCAAWDTCYRDIYTSGRYTFLSWPERGSAAWNNLGRTSVETGMASGGGAVQPGYPGLSADLQAALANMSTTSGRVLPQLAHQAYQLQRYVNTRYRGPRTG